MLMRIFASIYATIMYVNQKLYQLLIADISATSS